MDKEKKKPVIKIFSTQRIDKKSELFDCDTIIPVRCGAIFDKSFQSEIPGDDSGENISAKRLSFCELTTQFWAYKNVEADYYGFCHYRRYFSFAKERFPTDRWKSVIDSFIDEKALLKYGINDESIAEAVEGFDIILPDVIPLRDVGIKSVFEQYKSAPLLNVRDLSLLLEIIKEKSPDTYPFAEKYFQGDEMVLCTMMIMKKEYFFDYSRWLFDILFEFEKRWDMKNLNEEALRTPGHLGERLLYIYCMYLKETKNVSVKHLQMVVFSHPESPREITPVFFGENAAHIVLSTSLYYAPFCAATVKSIIDTSREEHNYDIVILHTELQEKTERLFLKMIEGRKNFSIRFSNVGRKLSSFRLRTLEHFSRETYYRLAINSFLCGYKKVLYLDSDLIARRDVFELYKTELDGFAVAGAVDVCLSGINNGYNKEKPIYYKERAFIKDENLLYMINAGVLLMNLEFIGEKYTTEALLKYAEESNFELCDQDVINSLFQDDILLLDQRWNTANYEEETLPAWCVKFAPKSLTDSFKEAEKNPYIIHYGSTIKPWNEPGYKHADLFWQTLRETPFYEYLIHRRIAENASYFAGAVRYDMEKVAKGRRGAPKVRKRPLLRLVNKLFPRGTLRREFLKKIVCFITRKPYVKPYYPVA